MFRFVVRKMISKRWMVLALLIGNILLISITASNPMYTQAVLQRTLNNTLQGYLTEKNRYPATVALRATGSSRHNDLVLNTMELLPGIPAAYDLPAVEQIGYYSLNGAQTESNLERDDRGNSSIILGCMTDLPDHITLVSGTVCSPQPDENGIFDVMVSERGLVSMKLLPGEILTFPKINDPDGNPLRARIAGVFRNSDPEDPYWVQAPNAYSSTLFLDQDLFHAWFLSGEMPYGVSAAWYCLMDYTAMRADKVEHMLAVTQEYTEYFDTVANQSYICSFSSLLTEFQKTERKVRTTLWVLQTPIFVLLAAFIFMVSRQMLDMEQGEIAVLKSRGAGRGQVINIYFVQSVVIALMALAAGLPLAMFLVQVLGSANAFLEFVRRSALSVEIDAEAVTYAVAAAVFSVAAMVLPVFRYSRFTIVGQKQKKHKKSNAPLWQKLFLDVLALGVAIYGLYTFGNQREILAQRVMEGAALDPLLFLSSSLFMLGAGLLALRILPMVVWTIFTLFKRFWSPALYTSFVKVLRTRNQQGFIMVFLIMTIALGVFDASAARTINSHDEQNLRYTIGADIVLQEKWADNREQLAEAQTSGGTNEELEYKEPDYGRYTSLAGVKSITRVLVDDGGSMSVPGGKLTNIRIMGINTREFGETAWFDSSLLPQHWYHYLNAMSQKARAVLVSTNFREDYGYAIGDAITYRGAAGDSVRGIIYGFVDYWPGYTPVTYTKASNGLYSEKENYLIVANLSQLQANWGITPYQIWIKALDSSQFIYDFARDNGIVYQTFRDASAEIVSMKNDPVIQGTNGVLTVGFIVVLALCTVGFLIYWVLSIRSRELQFGIFRAMGMSMREIVSMLVNEHIFISGAAILTGAAVGRLTAKLYMPLIQIAYSSSDSAIPLRVINLPGDMLRLAIVVGIMIGACLIILGELIRRMKIAQALKLGED
ncbi:MAG: FtsX-like permease family protein [Eubacteriales bacterium]|nr:FtsX-like permease family protein [Eubacteriales bacterium]